MSRSAHCNKYSSVTGGWRASSRASITIGSAIPFFTRKISVFEGVVKYSRIATLTIVIPLWCLFRFRLSTRVECLSACPHDRFPSHDRVCCTVSIAWADKKHKRTSLEAQLCTSHFAEHIPERSAK